MNSTRTSRPCLTVFILLLLWLAFGASACESRSVDRLSPAEIEESIGVRAAATEQAHQATTAEVDSSLDEASRAIDDAVEQAGETIEEVLPSPDVPD